MLTLSFFLNAVLLGAGLAMDAFSVSIANALAEPRMRRKKSFGIAAAFAFFQFLMPLIGWLMVKTLVKYFKAFEAFIPYIALILLSCIGIKAIIECIKHQKSGEAPQKPLGIGTLLVQGVATSIDALSVGFTIEQYAGFAALTASLIIGAVTFALCLVGLLLGKKCSRYFQKAEIIGGIILIAIGVEIFMKGILN